MMNENSKNKGKLFWILLIVSIIIEIIGIVLFLTGVYLISENFNKPDIEFPTGGVICLILSAGFILLGIALFIGSIIVKAGKFAYKKGKEYQYKKKLESANRYCSYCGVENASNAKFCISCGAKLTKDDKKL